MNITQATQKVFKLTKQTIYAIFSLWLIPLYAGIIAMTWIYNFTLKTFNSLYNFVVDGPIMRLIKYIIGIVYEIFESLKVRSQQVRPAFLRHLRSEQQMANIFQRASSNPDEITENQKVLMLMQKMRKLQQTIFQQSVDRRKAEQQLFDLKVQFSQKNGTLIRQRSQNVQIMNKLNVLTLQLAEKVELLDKSKKQVQQLTQQLQSIRTHVQQEASASTRQQQDQAQKVEQTHQEQIQGQQQSAETVENKTQGVSNNAQLNSTTQKKKNKKR